LKVLGIAALGIVGYWLGVQRTVPFHPEVPQLGARRDREFPSP
jgi:hypothetical protein